jgi:hypothetical protein
LTQAMHRAAGVASPFHIRDTISNISRTVDRT